MTLQEKQAKAYVLMLHIESLNLQHNNLKKEIVEEMNSSALITSEGVKPDLV